MDVFTPKSVTSGSCVCTAITMLTDVEANKQRSPKLNEPGVTQQWRKIIQMFAIGLPKKIM
jgi:hypothetical protein